MSTLTRSLLLAPFLAALLLLAPTARAQDAYGLGNGSDGAYVAGTLLDIVNVYSAITASSSGTTVTVTSSAGFAAGDLVLVWQVQAGPLVSGSAATIDLATQAAGTWELRRVVSTTATTLVLDTALTSTYRATGAQVVRVPEYTTVSVPFSRSIIALPWNGSVGGIVAFMATGAVDVTGTIDVSGRGFRGGGVSNNNCSPGCNCGIDFGPVDDPTCITGRRGEGIDSSSGAYDAIACGIGNRGNGGGGGGEHNAGGAGGGNGGAGGPGGVTWCSRADLGGRPGVALTGSLLTRLTLGGGGGGGHQNNGVATAGTNGGGAIVVRALSVTGTGTWRAEGSPILDTSANDGQGGGGAGGSVLVQVVESFACGLVNASGGNGGTTTDHGNGGGGGGGRVRIDARTSTCTNVTVASGLPGSGGYPFPGGGTGGGATGGIDTGSTGSFGCRTSADCSGATPICDTATHACRGTTCGDGIFGGSEGCDDGDMTGGDGCSATCTVEPGYVCGGSPSVCSVSCGNGVLNGAEACDDGNATAADGCTGCAIDSGWTCAGAPSSCSTTCGDGVRAGSETCDDGNTRAADGCSATCSTEAGFACMGTPSSCSAICGDGRLVAAEACDDGNTMGGDGCTALCATEAGFTCTGMPSRCATTCGDGRIGGTEVCDDGNTRAGDGCSMLCSPEAGWACMGAPSVCATRCGDMAIAGTEACDDGNTMAGDGCSAMCGVESGYACTGMPSVCTMSCDGVDCNDMNPCTTDTCAAGACSNTITAGAMCDDGDACTSGDVCDAAGMCGGTPSCDDAGVAMDDAGMSVGDDAAVIPLDAPIPFDADFRGDANTARIDAGDITRIDAGDITRVDAGGGSSGGGCNCRVESTSSARGSLWALLGSLGLVMAARRRRRTR